MAFLKDLKNKKIDFAGIIRKYAILSIILGIVGLAIGVLFIIAPIRFTALVIWIALGLCALLGLVAIVRFIFPGKSKRDGFSLALGILVVAAFVCVLVCACTFKSGTWKGESYTGFEGFSALLVVFFSIFFGVIAVFNSILALCLIGNVEKGQKGYVIFNSILGLVLGVLMIIFPFVLTAVAGIITGVYFIIISLFVIVAAIKALVAASKAKKVVVDATVEEVKEEPQDKE